MIVKKHDVNDLAKVSIVVSFVSEALMVMASRIRILYNGEVLDTTSMSKSSLYEVGRFNRNLAFQAVVIPLARCTVCRYLKTTDRPTTHCSLVKGVDYDYCYVPNSTTDRDGATLETLDSCEAAEVEEDYGWDTIVDLGDMQRECFCEAIAQEFGWKRRRFWQRLIRGLLTEKSRIFMRGEARGGDMIQPEAVAQGDGS